MDDTTIAQARRVFAETLTRMHATYGPPAEEMTIGCLMPDVNGHQICVARYTLTVDGRIQLLEEREPLEPDGGERQSTDC